MKNYLTSSKEAVHFFVEYMVASGIRSVVVSPGSRNAPLSISVDEHPDLTCYVVHDERSAAFFALGLAQMSKTPVALVCTSGSAVANYYPAITEAYYQSVPLLVVSADRPEEWINQGDGQTIMQKEIFGGHVHEFLSFSDKMSMVDLKETGLQKLNKLFKPLFSGWKGPVHLNFALEEPLYQTVDAHLVLEPIKWEEPSSEKENWEILKERWKQASKKLILVGQMEPNSTLQLFLEELSLDPSVVILVENTSNLVHPSFIHCIDRTIENIHTENQEYCPEILLTLGGAVVSKRIKNLLRSWKIKEHWRVGLDFPEMDTYRQNPISIQSKEEDFLRELKKQIQAEPSDFFTLWKSLDWQAKSCLEVLIPNLEFSDLKLFSLIFDYLPDASKLHLANSSVVRYAQLFDPLKGVQFFSNRGTSGIDGSTSTAAGAASHDPESWHILVTGDISFFYDSNALWNRHLSPNLRIILINNGGGGIFKIIPGPHTTKQYLPYFVAEHKHSAKGICESYQVEYSTANSVEEFEQAMEGGFWNYNPIGRPSLIEVWTDECANEEVLAKFWQSIRK